MNEQVEEIEIAAPPAAVWAVLEDVRRMPELSPSTVSVTAPERLTRVGEQFEQAVRLAGRTFRSTWTVTDIEPGRRLAIDGRLLPGTRYSMVEEVRPLDDGRRTCLRLTMRWKLPFGPVGRLAGKLGAEQRATAEATAVLAGVRRLAEATTTTATREAH
jgi:carbon monoxide dehydrogenase subunit G